MSRKTHAQHLKRLADKQRRHRLLCRWFGGIVVSPRMYDYLFRHIDEIAAIGEIRIPAGLVEWSAPVTIASHAP